MKSGVAILVLGPAETADHLVRRLRAGLGCAHVAQVQSVDELTHDDAGQIEGLATFTGVGVTLIDRFPKLQIVANFGVGYDHIDVGHATARRVVVTNTPDVLNDEVADTAVGLLLNTIREFPQAESWLRNGHWARGTGYRLTPLTLRGRRVGIFGMGRIGRAIAERIAAFGLPIAYHNRRPVESVPYEYHASLLSLAQSVDTLVSVAPGTPATAKAVDAAILKALGPSGVFVNVGRGSTVDQPALIRALTDGTIAAAGLDVFDDEPNVPTALLELHNVSVLPHVGSASLHTRTAMASLQADNLISWFSGKGALTPIPESRHLVPGN